jgi:hypothetical protein
MDSARRNTLEVERDELRDRAVAARELARRVRLEAREIVARCLEGRVVRNDRASRQ